MNDINDIDFLEISKRRDAFYKDKMSRDMRLAILHSDEIKLDELLFKKKGTKIKHYENCFEYAGLMDQKEIIIHIAAFARNKIRPVSAATCLYYVSFHKDLSLMRIIIEEYKINSDTIFKLISQLIDRFKYINKLFTKDLMDVERIVINYLLEKFQNVQGEENE